MDKATVRKAEQLIPIDEAAALVFAATRNPSHAADAKFFTLARVGHRVASVAPPADLPRVLKGAGVMFGLVLTSEGQAIDYLAEALDTGAGSHVAAAHLIVVMGGRVAYVPLPDTWISAAPIASV
jgi:hypothetical protein